MQHRGRAEHRRRQGLYFRTAPPDDLQAAALTDIIMRDGLRGWRSSRATDAYG
jgi:hypothetical protein